MLKIYPLKRQIHQLYFNKNGNQNLIWTQYRHTKLDENVFEVVLTVTATVCQPKSNCFFSRSETSWYFYHSRRTHTPTRSFIKSFCPSILFPYAREAITSQVINGSFPQLVLAPINFDALYMQQLEKNKKLLALQSKKLAH